MGLHPNVRVRSKACEGAGARAHPPAPLPSGSGGGGGATKPEPRARGMTRAAEVLAIDDRAAVRRAIGQAQTITRVARRGARGAG